MKKIFNLFLIATAIILGFFYPKGQPFYGLTKIFAFAIMIYYVLKLSQRIKSKDDDEEV
jgi:hypothetical protein